MKKLTFIGLILNLSFQLMYSQISDSVNTPKINISKHSDLSTFVASKKAAFSNTLKIYFANDQFVSKIVINK